MKIEELYPAEQQQIDDFVVTIRAKKQNKPFGKAHKKKKTPVQSKEGSKTVRKKSPSNMRLEQLNKHEEKSYIQDAEANEAILKNTVSREELCKFLTPLKFLEIQTWRQEVPYGDTINEAEVEHRRWRTPIEILLPTSGKDDDDSWKDGINGSSKDSSIKKKSTSTNSKRRRFFEDVRKQNAEMLRRSHSDATKLDRVRPRIRDTISAGGKNHPNETNENNILSDAPSANNTVTAQGRLRTAYAPAGAIPPYKNSKTQSKKSGHIYVNHTIANAKQLSSDPVVASYFSPGKPVLSRIHQSKREDQKTRSNPPIDNKFRSAASADKAGSNRQQTSSSSWTATAIENHLAQDSNYIDGGVQILQIDANRPHTVGNETARNRNELYQRHMKFQGVIRAPARGYRHWNNRRTGVESSFNAATRLYQNAVLPKRVPPPRTIEKIRHNKTAGSSREPSSRNDKVISSMAQAGDEQPTENINLDNSSPRQSAKTSRSRNNSNHVTKISYALNRPNEIKVRTLRGPKQRETMSRVTPIPPIEMALNSPEQNPFGDAVFAQTMEKGALKYLSTDGIIELNSIHARKPSNSPWVSEAFTPLTGNESYYARQHRQNKSVTFRLGAS